MSEWTDDQINDEEVPEEEVPEEEPSPDRLAEIDDELARLDAQAEAPAPQPIATDNWTARMHGLPPVDEARQEHEAHHRRVNEARAQRAELRAERDRLRRDVIESNEYKAAIAAAQSPTEVLDVQRRFRVGSGIGQVGAR